MKVSRRVLAIAGGFLGVIATAGMAVGPLIRSRAASFAASRSLNVTIGHVSPGWFSVELGDVQIVPAGGGFASVHLPAVRVELGPLFGVERIEAHGVEVRIIGSSDEVLDGIRAWRNRAPDRPGTGGRTGIALDGVAIEWRERPEEQPIAAVSGASFVRTAGAWRASFDAAHGEATRNLGKVRVDVDAGTGRFGAGGVLTEVRAARMSISWVASDSLSTSTLPPNAEPTPPPLPPVPIKRTKRDPKGAAEPLPAARLPLPDPASLHAKLVAVGAVFRERLADGARVDVDALAFELHQGERRLKVGQGPLSVSRKSEALSISFRTRADANGTPLELAATLPLAAGDAQASLAGGPVSLALLGVDEGAAGLVDVDRTTVGGQGHISLSAAGDALTFDAKLGIRGLAVNDPRLALDLVRGIDASMVARGVLDDHGALRLDDAELTLGAIHALGHGSLEQTADHLSASIAVELPNAQCDSLLRSIPSALVPTLAGAEMTGTLGMHGRIAFDSRNLDDTIFDWSSDDRCAMSVVPEGIAHDRFTQPFDYTIYLPDGTLAAQTTGPTTDDWTPLSQISPFMQVAVLTTEDGAFYKHHGFNRGAIRNALVADLKAGRFVRGASTITMQLAKNLFLSRDKTLSRKLEELILADYLEQAFTKQEMIELYLNVIEFGPGVYGITQAAQHYFGRKPAELNLAECLFLSSILPSPIRFHKLAEKPALGEGWTKHLRELMAIAAKLGTISGAELEEGLKEDVAFHDPKDPPPPARPAVTGTHFQSTLEPSSEWDETP